uniref:Uncharacterized protein n=1 Tax=Romanomermis culicivorax TaxID=13658 RepID=A0A915IG19_ROMCU
MRRLIGKGQAKADKGQKAGVAGQAQVFTLGEIEWLKVAQIICKDLIKKFTKEAFYSTIVCPTDPNDLFTPNIL